MVAAILDLNDDRIIEQGSRWEMGLRYPGDVTGASIRAEIRKHHQGELIATIRSLPAQFDEETNQTAFLLFLNAGLTEKIPVPPAGEFWLYDLLIYLPGQEPRRLLKGRVFVDAGITNV
jgi:hypothetical protein